MICIGCLFLDLCCLRFLGFFGCFVLIGIVCCVIWCLWLTIVGIWVCGCGCDDWFGVGCLVCVLGWCLSVNIVGIGFLLERFVCVGCRVLGVVSWLLWVSLLFGVYWCLAWWCVAFLVGLRVVMCLGCLVANSLLLWVSFLWLDEMCSFGYCYFLYFCVCWCYCCLMCSLLFALWVSI